MAGSSSGQHSELRSSRESCWRVFPTDSTTGSSNGDLCTSAALPARPWCSPLIQRHRVGTEVSSDLGKGGARFAGAGFTHDAVAGLLAAGIELGEHPPRPDPRELARFGGTYPCSSPRLWLLVSNRRRTC